MSSPQSRRMILIEPCCYLYSDTSTLTDEYLKLAWVLGGFSSLNLMLPQQTSWCSADILFVYSEYMMFVSDQFT